MTEANLQPWEVLKTRDVFVAEPWIRVAVQQVRLPDGRVVDDYYQIRLSDWTLIFAETNDGMVVVERQYKHGLGRVSLTLPAGGIESGETPLAAAQRELLEETGYVSQDWRPLGSFVTHGNYGVGTALIFRAGNARKVAEPNSPDLEETEVLTMTVDELLAAVRDGEVGLLGSMAAITLATNPLLNWSELGPQTSSSL